MQSPLTKLPGTVIDGRYEIESLLGVGGMSSVYRVRDRQLNRVVALKMLHPHITEHRGSAERFLQEAKAEGLIRHPNVIGVYAVNVTQPEGHLYIVMDYLQGESLAELIKDGALKDQQKALDLFLQTCRGLEAAHEKSIVHRDLKPSNVMLVDDGRTVKLVDFGIASLYQEHNREQRLTREGAVLGSPEYMSPEQCEGRNVDVRSDIYSMGCLMYEMLAGVVPFNGGNQIEIMCKHVAEEPPLVSAAAPWVAGGFDAIVRKCLAKEPGQRYQTVGELIDALENVDVADGAVAQVGAHAGWKRSARRHRLMPVTIAIGALLIGAGAFVVASRNPPAPAPPVVAELTNVIDPGETLKAYIEEGDRLWTSGEHAEATDKYDQVLMYFVRDTKLFRFTNVTPLLEHVVERASRKSVTPAMDVAVNLLRRSSVGQARAVAVAGAELAKKAGVPLTLGHDLIVMAECDALQARFDHALQDGRDAVKAYKDAPELDEGTFPGLLELVEVLQEQERFKDAGQVAQMSYDLAKHVDNDADAARCAYEAGFSYWRGADYACSAPWYDKCLAIRERTLPGDSPEVYLVQFDAGSAYQKAGQTAEAKRYFDKCRPQYEQLVRTEPTMEVKRRLAEMAEFYAAIGENKVATRLETLQTQ